MKAHMSFDMIYRCQIENFKPSGWSEILLRIFKIKFFLEKTKLISHK